MPRSGVAISESERRVEAVLVTLEGWPGREVKRLTSLREIVRGEDGKPSGLKPVAAPELGKLDLAGPVAELLPARRPSAEECALARALPDRMGHGAPPMA